MKRQDCTLAINGLTLPLHRYPVSEPRRSVLLLHGGSASSETFVTPAERNLVSWLTERHVDVWTLDWRGSNLVAAVPPHPAPGDPEPVFSIDAAAAIDVPAALRRIRGAMADEGRSEQPLAALGHCLGGGVLAAAVADKKLGEFKLDSIVLSALGLFYASPWDGWVKVQDYIIEQVLARTDHGPTVDVHVPEVFPPPMNRSYALWPKTLRIGCGVEICYQVSFMFGHPYLEKNLFPGIHNDARLEVLFNRMHLTLFKHCGQNLRRGVYAKLDESEDLVTLPTGDKPSAAGFDMPVTLITGERNMLWHRESIDRMYEWMRSNEKRDCVKHVFPGYAHQDLLWGLDAPKTVFPVIGRGLGLP
jgi:pimeloyl-ACP methyl ester carboxylesterase